MPQHFRRTCVSESSDPMVRHPSKVLWISWKVRTSAPAASSLSEATCLPVPPGGTTTASSDQTVLVFPMRSDPRETDSESLSRFESAHHEK